MSERGKYIVIEGNDGTGKSTQVSLLAEHLASQGHEAVIVEEPGSEHPERSTPVADELRKIIKNGSLERAPEINLALFSAARRELWHNKIQPALDRGAYVLSARNYLSTLAYQGRGEGLDSTEIERMTMIFTDTRYMHPDLLVVLALADTEKRKQRIENRGALTNPDTFEMRDDTFQDKVNQAYIDIATEHNLPIIDAGQTIDEIQHELQSLVMAASKR